jgi:intergrase/recombinase
MFDGNTFSNIEISRHNEMNYIKIYLVFSFLQVLPNMKTGVHFISERKSARIKQRHYFRLLNKYVTCLANKLKPIRKLCVL